MNKKLEHMHFSYEPIQETYLPTDSREEAHKLGYKKYNGYQSTPNLEYWALPDGSYIAIDRQYNYDGESINGVYHVTPENDTDNNARLEREEAEELKQIEAKAADLRARAEAKKQQVTDALKLLEKSGYKVTK